jgi:nucleoid-associated protein YgaU
MASRYTYSEVLKTKETNKQYLESTIYPKVKAKDTDMYIISEAGDRLDLLAHRYYGDQRLWWVIATANNINDATFYVEEGIQLRIPSDINAILNDLQKINK